MKRGIYIKRKISPIQEQDSSSIRTLSKDVKCAQCRLIFPDYMGACPKCGSEERMGLIEVNPYTRMPMSSFLKACGHVFWLIGVIAFLILIWQTNTTDKDVGILFFYAAIFTLVCGILMSAAYFALSELLKRVLRIQFRLHAFHETYRTSQHQYVLPRSSASKRRKFRRF